MTDKKISGKITLYDKYRRDLASNAAFGIAASFILFILVAVIIVVNFLFIKVKVSGSSMFPTLKSGDVVMVNAYGAPDYGDIIIISGEKSNGDWLIKRAIAFGGDTVKIEGGYVSIKKSGETEFTKLENEPYLANNGITFWNDVRASGWEIEEGQIFYLGDNRTNSSDSRVYGTCYRSQIVCVVSDFAVKMKGVNKFFEKLLIPFRRLFGLPVGKTD